MTKTKQIGNTYEKKTKALFEEKGWRVEKATGKIVWIPSKGGRRPITQHHDFFTLFDLICVKNGTVRFVQVKYAGANTSIPELMKLRKDISEFPCGGEIWIWKKEGNRVNAHVEYYYKFEVENILGDGKNEGLPNSDSV